MKRFRCIYSNWRFGHGCWQMCRWIMAFPVCMHSGFPTRRSKQTIVTSWNGVTVISHAILGGNYKKRAHSNLGAVVWVFGYWTVGYIDKSQTLYYSYLGACHGAEHNQNELCVLFIHMHASRPFVELFNINQVGHYLHPLEPSIEWSTDHNPLAADCKRDKSLVWCASLPVHLVYLCTILSYIYIYKIDIYIYMYMYIYIYIYVAQGWFMTIFL